MSPAGRAFDRNARLGCPAKNDGYRLNGRGDHGSFRQVSAYAIKSCLHSGMKAWFISNARTHGRSPVRCRPAVFLLCYRKKAFEGGDVEGQVPRERLVWKSLFICLTILHSGSRPSGKTSPVMYWKVSCWMAF